MTGVTGSTWKQQAVASAYLDRRRAIPLWDEQAGLVRQLLARPRRPITRFLDLGSGDGLVAEIVLEAWPSSEAVLVDMSRPMLEAAEERLGPGDGRWTTVEADLAESAWVERLPHERYDAALSGFCIHHLTHERKRALYRELYGLLDPGGLFLNWEHVAPGWLSRGMFDERMVEGLVRLRPDRPADDVAREYRERPDAGENKLLDVETQCGWLREIGFEHVEVFFKWVELAVFGGVKTA